MLSGVNRGSPWALTPAEGASNLLEVALGSYSSASLLRWRLPGGFDAESAAQGVAREPDVWTDGSVRITVFCSPIVIDVIVHCHTAGALLSQTAENNCPYHRVVGFLILSGQFIITLVAELGIQPLIRSFWTETSAITFSTFSIAVTVFPSSTYGGDLSLSVDGACIIAFPAQCTGL